MKRTVALLRLAVICGLAASPAWAEVPIGEEAKLKLYGDVRFRAESDWDSLDSMGVERADRDRLRLRFRLGFNYAFDEHFSFGGRLRSGTAQDQQSPHQTLGDEFETKSVNIDKAFIQATWKHGWLWAGKNAFAFWTQNELFWDEDVTPEGVAAGWSYALGESPLRLKPVVGYFVLEASGSSNEIGDKSDMAGAQLTLDSTLKPVDLTFAAGYYAFTDNPATPDTALADMDYDIWVLGAKATFKTARPWSLGVDYMRNTADYPTTLFNADQDTGYVFGVNWGGLKQKSDWLVGYYYAHIEKFAVVARFAQDDWLRWGTGPETRSSNFEGHEFRLAYAFRPSWNVMLRVYVVEGIEPESALATSLEDGKRARLDFNMAF